MEVQSYGTEGNIVIVNYWYQLLIVNEMEACHVMDEVKCVTEH